MARLIDAEKLNFHCNYNGDCSGDVSHCKECDNYVLDYRDIQEYPTAYDTDKVVEKLEKRRMDALRHLRENKGTEFGYASECVYNALNEAVEIVKGGGVDE